MTSYAPSNASAGLIDGKAFSFADPEYVQRIDSNFSLGHESLALNNNANLAGFSNFDFINVEPPLLRCKLHPNFIDRITSFNRYNVHRKLLIQAHVCMTQNDPRFVSLYRDNLPLNWTSFDEIKNFTSEFLDLCSGLNFPTDDIKLVQIGSSVTGFSGNLKKSPKPWTPDSDVDLAIVSPKLDNYCIRSNVKSHEVYPTIYSKESFGETEIGFSFNNFFKRYNISAKVNKVTKSSVAMKGV
eukprot:CAMPEP_0182490130 /NCGR_PEP_ID=MMETSP1321-20130603/109_1 /TAXON_ID=91990 /ORGANISM="Bolidomonas sp., Strain RCC1657" /LENGTH=240 /DNA_ID=CAMNT_0024692267 /DNA_START=346 /DNA_END=1066 /DNA_ORIENTATION=-